MILRGAEAVRFLDRPDPARPGLLLYGADPMRVALKRQQAVAALIGPAGEAEMRLTRLPAGDLRRDPALAADSLRESGFFPGPRVVLVEDAADSHAAPLASALGEWRAGDAFLIVTAGQLGAKSPLRLLFEKHPTALCIALYDDPPTPAEIEAELTRAGLARPAPAAMAELIALSRALDPGDFRQTLERIALYKFGDPSPLSPDEIAALAPATVEAGVDDLIHAVAEGALDAIGPLLRRLEGQGILPVTLCIAALRHFRTLHHAAADPAGVAAALARARAFGPRRERMERQARAWGTRGLETAVAELLETDLALRSSTRAPAMAVMERTLLRIAAQRARRR